MSVIGNSSRQTFGSKSIIQPQYLILKSPQNVIFINTKKKKKKNFIYRETNSNRELPHKVDNYVKL